MARNFESELDDWLRSIDLAELKALKEYHCEVIPTLRFLKLDYNFLIGAIHFWNPSTHSFVFHNNELTPLPEELSAIVNWPIDCPPCYSKIYDSYSHDLERFLGLDNGKSWKLVHRREVDLIGLIDHFKQNPNMVFRRRALVYCLFCRFLFMHNSNGYGLTSVVNIVEQCEVGRSPMVVCAGELMLALDDMKKNNVKALTGCPHILQVNNLNNNRALLLNYTFFCLY